MGFSYVRIPELILSYRGRDLKRRKGFEAKKKIEYYKKSANGSKNL